MWRGHRGTAKNNEEHTIRENTRTFGKQVRHKTASQNQVISYIHTNQLKYTHQSMLVKQVFFFPALMHNSQLVHCSRTADQSLKQTDISTSLKTEASRAPRTRLQIATVLRIL